VFGTFSGGNSSSSSSSSIRRSAAIGAVHQPLPNRSASGHGLATVPSHGRASSRITPRIAAYCRAHLPSSITSLLRHLQRISYFIYRPTISRHPSRNRWLLRPRGWAGQPVKIHLRVMGDPIQNLVVTAIREKL